MIEGYAFLVAFTVQILVMSVLLPAGFIRNFRAKATGFPAERLAQLYPGVDVILGQERFLARYRVLIFAIAVLGLLLLAWQFSAVWRADWNGAHAGLLATGYFLVALLVPVFMAARFAVRFHQQHKPADGKRTAMLQRRGLFDFVSPFVVSLAIVSYFLYAAFLFYIEQHPFPGFAGPLVNIVGMTLLYAMYAVGLYVVLYGKKSPLDTHAIRLQTIGLAVKGIVYACILGVVNLSLSHSLRLLELKSWEPVVLTIFLAISAIFCSMGFAAPLRKPETDGIGSSAAV